MGLCCVELYYTPPSAWLTLGVLLCTGLVFALLTLYFQVILEEILANHKYIERFALEISYNIRVFILRWGCADGNN